MTTYRQLTFDYFICYHDFWSLLSSESDTSFIVFEFEFDWGLGSPWFYFLTIVRARYLYPASGARAVKLQLLRLFASSTP